MVFFLVTGASGMGKSTIRERIQDHVRGFADVSELADVAGTPEWSLRWRHQAVDRVPHHLAFANRMRRHVTDPTHFLDVISEERWEEMRWERYREHHRQGAPWDWHSIDTSDLAPDAVAGEVMKWILRARGRQAQSGRRWKAGGFP